MNDTVAAHEDDDAAAADKLAGAVVYVLAGRLGFMASGLPCDCGACTILHGVVGCEGTALWSDAGILGSTSARKLEPVHMETCW